MGATSKKQPLYGQLVDSLREKIETEYEPGDLLPSERELSEDYCISRTTVRLALKELEAGGVDAVVADNGVIINYVNNNAAAGFKTVSDSAFAPEQYGIAVKKGNAELLEKVNQGLAAIKADGSYDQIYAKTFGAAPAPAAAASK